ncbi:MAG: methyltransferase domain-containing protein [Nitriliruptorales bacterium]|nr:methyltransferase domain-containing protein [Nitriliruptorales bacterium]
MLDSVVALLRCPVCGDDVELRDASLVCARAHRFDVARQGYVNLLPGGTKHAGDTAAMVVARGRFLDAGHFAPLLRAVAGEARRWELAGEGGAVVDLGAGTGHYLAAVLDALPGWSGLAVDVSKYAARRAARAHPRAGAVVADVWRPLPVGDAAADLALDVFAPRNVDEIRRILHPGGAFVVVTPAPDHLRELVDPLGLVRVDPDKHRRLERDMAALARIRRSEVRFELRLDRGALEALVRMGPSGHHHGHAELRDLLVDVAEPTTVTCAVHVSVYRHP